MSTIVSTPTPSTVAAETAAVDAAQPHFIPFDLPASNQRVLGSPHPTGALLPLALKPDSDTTLDGAIATVRKLQEKGTLTSLLATHGALLFRGVPITEVGDFSRFAHAFGYASHEIIGIVLDRPELAPNVSPANESPPEVLLYSHNESPQVPHAPEYIFFYGHKADQESGGETPLSSSLELYERAKAEIPDFIAELAEKGVLSRVVYKPEAQYPGGSTLRQAFGKEIVDSDDEKTRRAKIETQIRRYGRGENTAWEWQADGGITITHHLPGLRTQAGTGLPTLFTGLAAYYRNSLHNVNSRNYTSQLFGDGTPIPEHYLAKLAEITDELRVLHKWQKGDVLVFDNVIAQHGRQPWRGAQADRIVYASLFDGDLPGAYNSMSWAQVVQAE